MLYGADLAKREIAQRRQAVVVEGYTDVMACPSGRRDHRGGDQRYLVRRGAHQGAAAAADDADQFRGEVIFTFDGDTAGQRAALRAFAMEEKFVTQTFVAVQPDGLDPCDLRLKKGGGAVKDLIAQRVPLFEFAIRSAIRRHDLDTAEGRLAALDEAGPIVAGIKDRGLRQLYAVNLDRWLGMMDERFVLERVAAHWAPAPARRGTRGGEADRSQPGEDGRSRASSARQGRARGKGRGSRAGPPRRSATTPTIPWSTWSARRSSWPCSARRCAGRPSTC